MKMITKQSKPKTKFCIKCRSMYMSINFTLTNIIIKQKNRKYIIYCLNDENKPVFINSKLIKVLYNIYYVK